MPQEVPGVAAKTSHVYFRTPPPSGFSLIHHEGAISVASNRRRHHGAVKNPFTPETASVIRRDRGCHDDGLP